MKTLSFKSLLLSIFGLVTIAFLSACGSGGGGSPTANNTLQGINWQECNNSHAGDASYQCATLSVPLDYATPSLGTTTIGVVKYAKNPSNNNYLFVNSGGPWGVNTGINFGAKFTSAVLDKYAMIGFDPRGVGMSQNLTCDNSNIKSQMDAITTTSMDTFNQLLNLHDQMYNDCSSQFGGFQKFMSTNLTAQDMDYIRQRLGAAKISFLGYSYGTQLGTVYLMKYPEHIDKMILDGNVGPSRDLNVFFGGTIAAFNNGLNYFFDLCDSNPNCLLYQKSRSEFATATALVASGVVKTQDNNVVGLNNFYSWIRNYLNKENNFYQIVNLIHEINTNHTSPAGFLIGGKTRMSQDYVLNAVVCSDYYKTTNQNLINLFAQAQADYNGSDIAQNYAAGLYVDCSANWTELSQPLSTAKGVTPKFIIIGNYHDPATGYVNSTDLHAALPSSRLLTYTGGGHTIYSKSSVCINNYVNSYLLDGVLPAQDVICNDAQNSTSQPTQLSTDD